MKEQYTLKEDGFRAIWFKGNQYIDKVIIYMTGAKCGEKLTVDGASYLREAGYSVLCLGFYYWKGMPGKMYDIPVEYVERAVAELKKNGFAKIAIHGISTGAGYALLCSSLIPDITCTLAVSPYDYVKEAMKNDLFPLGRAVYTYRSKSVAYSKYTCLNHGLFKAFMDFLRRKKAGGYKMAHLMRYAYDTGDENEASRIKVENCKSDMLFLAPGKDDCWPSEKAIVRMERILKEANYPYRVKAVCYENGSHAIGMDERILEKSPILRFGLKMSMPMERNDPAACSKARIDSVKQILDFLKEW